jgi:hypothetical protein
MDHPCLDVVSEKFMEVVQHLRSYKDRRVRQPVIFPIRLVNATEPARLACLDISKKARLRTQCFEKIVPETKNVVASPWRSNIRRSEVFFGTYGERGV